MIIFTIIKEESTRCPGKNFREIISGVPLWKHFLRKFSDSKIFIDTDSLRLISEIASDDEFKNVNAYMRLPEHINDYNPTNEMFERFLDEYEIGEDVPLVYTHITAPFLREPTLRDAVDRFARAYPHYDSAASCVKEHNFAYVRNGDKYLPVNFNPQEIVRSQDLPPIVFLSHGFYVTTKKMFKKYRSRIGPNPMLIDVDGVESFDIDTEADWDKAVEIAHGL